MRKDKTKRQDTHVFNLDLKCEFDLFVLTYLFVALSLLAATARK